MLALDVLSRGGVVFGAGYDENLRVIHKPIFSPDELDSLRRSKYVESYIGESFKQVKSYLKDGRLVLFSGVQCQIHGLHSFLRKPYANLLTIEVICNSVPSPKVFEIYKQSLLEEDDEVVLDVNFRGKDYGWGKGEFAIKTKTKTKTKTKKLPTSKVPYMTGFLGHYITRPSCENCYAKGFKSGADITLGDYWGVHVQHPEFDDTKGVTCALIHSKQGADFMEAIADSMEIVPSSFEKVSAWNQSLIKPHKYPRYPFISREKVLRNVLMTYERELGLCADKNGGGG
nr:Coenzyme F420 hydrogenase/dehydrogenase, beta subunit C-terminal domain [uncultured Helicobacter sp.]